MANGIQQKPQVDRTKPSTACEPCRKTRSKCDRQRPYCSQCVRKSRVCSGYRDSFDLLLRDESDKVQLRIGKKKGSTCSTLSSSSSRTNTPPPSSHDLVLSYAGYGDSTVYGPEQQDNSIFMILDLPDSVVATNFFFSSFAQGMYLDYIPKLYGRHDRSEVLEASFEALALSFLAKSKNSPRISEKALRKYSLALQKTTGALSTETVTVQDDVIASVMLLALFAAFSCEPSDAVRTWTNHIDGAMILINMRPPGSFSDPNSQLMLNHVISAIQINCFRRKISFPSQMSRLYDLSWQSQDPFWRQFWDLIGAIASLQESSVRGKTDIGIMIDQAWGQDCRAAALSAAMPRKQEDAVFQGTSSFNFDRNRILRAHHAMNMIRVSLNSFIASRGKLYLAADYSTDELYRDLATTRVLTAKITINYIVTEICDSIPDFLVKSQQDQDHELNKTVWICTFIWPLAMALESQVLTESLEQHVRQRLAMLSLNAENADVARLALQVTTEDAAQTCASALYFC